MLTRRGLLAGLGGTAAFAAGGRFLTAPAAARPVGPMVEPIASGVRRLDLRAAERPTALACFGGQSLPLWTFQDENFLPIVRLRLGERLETHLANDLPRAGEHTSIHWHGIRLPNDQDGVPYVTQAPVEPGAGFDYAFTPPDAGTFFFHTHCNTAEQLGRGLVGILVVEGDETEPYDADEVLALRDWRIGEGGFLPFITDQGAARAGTFGTVRSCNGATLPTIPTRASADVRLRVLNVDPSRIMEIGVADAEAMVVAIDGIAVPPFALRSWRMGPAMRIDLVVRTPSDGGTATLVDYFSAEPVPLAVLAARGSSVRSGPFDPAPLRAGRIPEPDVATAERLRFDFSATATGAAVTAAAEGATGIPGLDELCLSSQTFWAINRQAWPSTGHRDPPPPVAELVLGRSYVFELRNLTPHQHPIHIHGHTWRVLGSNKRDLPEHHADTIVLLPRERMEVTFVADNPGDWMFHCHLIEHQETGMMSYVRVA